MIAAAEREQQSYAGFLVIETCARVSRWIQAPGTGSMPRPWQRAATCWTQAVLVLRCLVDGTDVPALARDTKVSQVTAYRNLHEAIDVIAATPPDLPEVVEQGRLAGWSHVAIDGTLIESTRYAAGRRP